MLESCSHLQALRDYLGDLWLSGDVSARVISDLSGLIAKALLIVWVYSLDSLQLWFILNNERLLLLPLLLPPPLLLFCDWRIKQFCISFMRQAGSDAAAAVHDLESTGGGGNAAKKLSTVFGVKAEREFLYQVQVPLSTDDGVRQMHWVPICLPHEDAARALYVPGTEKLYMRHVTEPNEITPDFASHLVVQRTEKGLEGCVPFKVFIDAAGFTKADSFIGWFAGSIYSDQSFCCALLRKADLCRCGCRGQHSIQAVEQALAWSFVWGAQGVWPIERHDKREWMFPRDGRRAAMGGQQLLPGDLRLALLEYRADLLQMRDGLGIAHWKSAQPCAFCKVPLKHVYKLRPFEQRTEADYDHCRVQNTIVVRISGAQWQLIEGFLAFSHKWRGRSIRRPANVAGNIRWRAVLLCGLKHGDTLQCAGDITDAHAASQQLHFAPFATVFFYRATKQLVLPFLSPWFSVPGFILPRRLRLDVLHVADLGTTPRYIGTVLRSCLDAGIFGNSTNAWDGLLRELNTWYKQVRAVVAKSSEVGKGFSEKRRVQ